MSSTCPHNMVNFGPLAAKIDPVVWGTPPNLTGFASWQHYCTASGSGRQPNFVALNRGHHLCSAGWPSCWALAHILAFYQQHCMQRKKPVFNLLRGRFWVLSPRRRDTLHRWGVKYGMEETGPLHAKFHPHRCNDKGVGPHIWSKCGI